MGGFQNLGSFSGAVFVDQSAEEVVAFDRRGGWWVASADRFRRHERECPVRAIAGVVGYIGGGHVLELATADNSAPACAASRSTRGGVARGGSASALRGRHDPLAAPAGAAVAGEERQADAARRAVRARRVRKFGRHRFAGNSCSWSTVAKRGLGPACRVDGAVAACTDRRCQRGPPRRASEGSCNSRAPRAVRCVLAVVHPQLEL